jgi:hypothetical protein
LDSHVLSEIGYGVFLRDLVRLTFVFGNIRSPEENTYREEPDRKMIIKKRFIDKIVFKQYKGVKYESLHELQVWKTSGAKLTAIAGINSGDENEGS